MDILSWQVCRVFKAERQSQNLGNEGPNIKFDHVKKRYRLSYVGPEEYLVGET